METEIRRVHFFDGQFLKEGDFIAEQLYHLHMRRRLNYVLFDQSGVVPVESADDLRFIDLDAAARTFRVRAGMAIGRRADLREGREVILRDDSPIFDLVNEGVTAGGTAWVTLHYAEVGDANPPSEGDVQSDTRTNERAQITVHSSAPPATEPATGEPYIVLGQIDFDSMSEDYSQRHEARLRSSLVGAPAAALQSIAVTPDPAVVTVGLTVQLTATGSFSDGTSAPLSAAVHGLVWSSDDTNVATVDPNGLVTGVSAAGTVVNAAAQGQAARAAVDVVPALGVPVINSWANQADRRRHGTETLTVFGDQFGAPMQVRFPPANATDPPVLVPAAVINLNEATVVVPGPFTPSAANPPVVRSGPIRVVTPAGESADSPQAFILETT